MDIILTSVAAVGFTPVMAVLAAVIMLEDAGSPFFFQPRHGVQRRLFKIAKMRTMRDARDTRVGNVLRDSGLDEVLQFVNVLRGEMSLVGPRPLTPSDVVDFGWSGPAMDWRFAARPGITGLAQVVGGRTLARSWRLDRLYLARQSIPLDLALVGAAFLANLAGKRRMYAVADAWRRRRRATRQARIRARARPVDLNRQNDMTKV